MTYFHDGRGFGRFGEPPNNPDPDISGSVASEKL
jgi:hypothetical protein